MTRDDLLTLLRAWGWRAVGGVPDAYTVWEHPEFETEVIVPADESKADYAKLLRRAVHTLAQGESMRLLAFAREVEALHQPRPNGTSALYPVPLCSCDAGDYPCPTAKALNRLEAS